MTGSDAGSTPASTPGRVKVFFSCRIVLIVTMSLVLNLGKEALMIAKNLFQKLKLFVTHPGDGSTAPYPH